MYRKVYPPPGRLIDCRPPSRIPGEELDCFPWSI